MITCIYKPGHMTMMATIPIYGTNPSNSSSQELVSLLQEKLICIAINTRVLQCYINHDPVITFRSHDMQKTVKMTL